MAEPLSPIGAHARQHDPDGFLCALFAPPAKREAYFALIGYQHELGRAWAAASNPLIAAIRLQWWRDALDEQRRHEVATPVFEAIAAGLLDRAALLAMADAREAEQAEEGFSTRAALWACLRGAHGGFCVAAGRLLGVEDPARLLALQAIGTAQGMAALLRAVAPLAARGRCLLPEDALAEAGLTRHEAMAAPERAAAVVSTLAREAGAGLPPPAGWGGAVAAALPAVLARRDLARLARGRRARRGTLDRLALTIAGLRARA